MVKKGKGHFVRTSPKEGESVCVRRRVVGTLYLLAAINRPGFGLALQCNPFECL